MVGAVDIPAAVGAPVLGVEVGVAVGAALGGLDVREPDAARVEPGPGHRPLVAGDVDALEPDREANGVTVNAAAADVVARPRPTAVPPGLVQPINAWPGAAMPWLRAVAVGCGSDGGRGRRDTAMAPVVAGAANVAPRRRRVDMGVPSLGQATGRMRRLPTCRGSIVPPARTQGKDRVSGTWTTAFWGRYVAVTAWAPESLRRRRGHRVCVRTRRRRSGCRGRSGRPSRCARCTLVVGQRAVGAGGHVEERRGVRVRVVVVDAGGVAGQARRPRR